MLTRRSTIRIKTLFILRSSSSKISLDPIESGFLTEADKFNYTYSYLSQKHIEKILLYTKNNSSNCITIIEQFYHSIHTNFDDLKPEKLGSANYSKPLNS